MKQMNKEKHREKEAEGKKEVEEMMVIIMNQSKK